MVSAKALRDYNQVVIAMMSSGFCSLLSSAVFGFGILLRPQEARSCHGGWQT
jgi:hypothetical protein